ncbi:MAG: hypothetical protein Q8L26_01695 [Candidatus Omnitrophota bacterium]|nr:hypothetical protein [Candidatus Omnitrophota bacterium]
MASYDQIIKVKSTYRSEARNFFFFLQAIGRKYTRPVKIKYRYLKRGRFHVIINGGPGGIDAILQELVLNRGLYYYSCSLPHKSEIISCVVLPIFKQLIDYRFLNPQSRFLRKHILGKRAQTDFVPTDMKNEFSYRFEVLFRKWDIGVTLDKDYLIELDAMLHNFLLNKLGHIKGERSEVFYKLLKRLKKIFMLDAETESSFIKTHDMRTDILHRLGSPKGKDELHEISNNLYRYFQYIDEFEESQKEKTIKIRGKRYKRIKYGNESALDENGKPYLDENGEPIDWDKVTEEHDCHDCCVKKGQYHVEGCDAEVCPKCGGQFISFDCGLPSE